MQKVNLKHGQLSATRQTAIFPSIYLNIYRTSNTPLVDYFTASEKVITKTFFFKDRKHYCPHFLGRIARHRQNEESKAFRKSQAFIRRDQESSWMFRNSYVIPKSHQEPIVTIKCLNTSRILLCSHCATCQHTTSRKVSQYRRQISLIDLIPPLQNRNKFIYLFFTPSQTLL